MCLQQNHPHEARCVVKFHDFDEKIHCIPSVKLSEFANSDTLFYDLTIQTKKDLTNFLKPISEGWCKNLI